MTTISGLTQKTTAPQDNDLVVIVDEADGTHASTGTTKFMEVGDFFKGRGLAPSKVLIQEIDLSTAGEFDFDNIPQDYDRLTIEGYLRGDAAVTADGLRLFFNADTTDANYHAQRNEASNAGALVGEEDDPFIGICTGASSPANSYSKHQIVLEDYSNSSRLKTARAEWSAYADTDHSRVGSSSVTSAITDPITRLRVRTDNHSTDQLTGKLRLYGEKSITIEDSETITVKQKVATITNTAAGEFDFDLTNYQNGDRIVIEGWLRGDLTATTEGCRCFLNADTTDANYHFQQSSASNGAAVVTEGDVAFCALVPGASSPANSYGYVRFVIEDYTGSNLKIVDCTSDGYVDTDYSDKRGVMVTSAITAAITRVRIRSDNHATDQLLGELTCYIEKQGVLPQMSGSRHLIEEIENTVAGEFDFDNIPSGYRRLVLKGMVRSDIAAVAGGLYLLFNADTTASNYHHQLGYAEDGAGYNFEGATPSIGNASGASAPASAYGSIEITIEGYDNAWLKQACSRFGVYRASGALSVGEVMLQHSTMTAALTRLRLRAANHATDQLLGKVALYGEY